MNESITLTKTNKTKKRKDLSQSLIIISHKLINDGRWIIFYGLWSAFKTIDYTYIEKHEKYTLNSNVATILIILFLTYFSTIAGFSVMRIGQGQRIRIRNIINLMFFLILSIISILVFIYAEINIATYEPKLSECIELLMETTFCILDITILTNLAKLHILRKKESKNESFSKA